MDLSGLNVEIEATQMATKKGVVDIIFLMDTTGSMGKAISEVGKNILNFIENIDPNQVKDWRIKVYSFGDFDVDGDDKFVTRDWVTKEEWDQSEENKDKLVKQFEECIKIVMNFGGGDEPESSLDAIYLSATQGFDADWQERTRVIVTFTDASPKPIKDETIGASVDDPIVYLAQTLTDNHVYVHLFGPINDDYKKLAAAAGKYVNYYVVNPQGEDPVEALVKVKFDEVLKTLGKSVSQASLVS